MAMFKGFKPQGMKKIASRMGYEGRMEEFDQYLQQNPDKQREMIVYQGKAQEMARGGVVRKMAVGGMPSYVNPITPPKDSNNPFGPIGAAVMSYGYNPKTNQYSISSGGQQSFPEGFESSMNSEELYKKYPQIKGSFEAGVPDSIPGGEPTPKLPKSYDYVDNSIAANLTNSPANNFTKEQLDGLIRANGGEELLRKYQERQLNQDATYNQPLGDMRGKFQAGATGGGIQPIARANIKDWSASEMGPIGQTQQATGRDMADMNIEDYSVQQALNPTLPQGGAAVAADTPINQAQMVDPNTGQLSPTGASVSSANLANTQTSTAPTPTDAAQTNAALSNLQVASTVAPIQGAQGAVSQQAQLNAQQQAASSVSKLQSAQGVANVMQNPVQRQIQSGEIVTGAANAQAASKFAEQIEAATATPSTQATVQGQLAGLTADFDTNNPPAWAAGALRGIQAQMASRGLGASSMAAQAMVQGALESALPIAQADAQTIASFEQSNLSNRQQRAMLAAQQRATFIGQEFDQAFQSRVQNAAKIGDIANMNFTAEQNIALENSKAANTMNLTNLGNKQAMVIAEASALANLDLSNLNNRQQAAVQNAQSFMQMDMSNLNNTQQAEMFKAQSLVQSLFNDQAASNASNQFNATSQNQTDQFFANLATTVSNFNAEQGNAMSRYNSGEVNALEQFNSTMRNQREQFNSQNRLVIDQSNAQWRRQVATSDTATINRVNEINAKSLLDLSTGAYNNLWQGLRDDMEFAWKSADNAQERAKDITLRKMQDESSVAVAALTADAAFSSSVGSSVLGLATNKITGPAIGGVVSSGANWLWDAGSSIISSIFGK